MLRSVVPLALLVLLSACGGAATPSPQSPTSGPAPSAEASTTNAEASKAAPKEQPGAPSSVPDAPRECADYAGEAPSTCASGAFDARLAAALDASAVQRDSQLRCLEAATEAPPGLVRALRAELAPRGCADRVLGDAAASAAVPRDIADTMVALGVAAKLFRTVQKPPLPVPPFNHDAFLKHFKEVLSPWIAAQAHAVDVLSQVGPRLSGYAKGIVAVEAGLADMRFVAVARAIELPDEMKKDPEIRETYLVALEQALEPRVARGRDAALVGLGELSRQGITHDARLTEARQLLSELYAGRRIDALDRLLVPPLPPLSQSSPALRVAAKLPAFYAIKLDTAPSVDDPNLLRARLEQGVPPSLWLNSSTAARSPELQALTRRALFELGQTYFWAEPFARAAAAAPPSGDAEAELIVALAKVLERGPRNAAAIMLGPPALPAELRDTATLDTLGKRKGPMAGLADFDAAYLRGLAPPANDPSFWKDQAQRYQSAQKKLGDKASAKLAGELGKAASDTEKELRKQPKP